MRRVKGWGVECKEEEGHTYIYTNSEKERERKKERMTIKEYREKVTKMGPYFLKFKMTKRPYGRTKKQGEWNTREKRAR